MLMVFCSFRFVICVFSGNVYLLKFVLLVVKFGERIGVSNSRLVSLIGLGVFVSCVVMVVLVECLLIIIILFCVEVV